MTKQTSKWRNRLAIVATGFAALGAYTVVNGAPADAGQASITVANVHANEGHAGNKLMGFTVKLSQPSAAPEWVKLQTAPSGVFAAKPGVDFQSIQLATLNFAPGETTKTFWTTVIGDTTDENNETYAANVIGNSPGTVVGDGTGVASITNDDAAPSISIDDVAKKEGTGGITAFTFTLKLSAPSGKIVGVAAAGQSGSAIIPEDLTAGPANIGWPAGTTSRTYTAHVNADSKVEPNETFKVALSNPSNATLADPTGIGTVTNDDFLVANPQPEPEPDPKPEPQPEPQPNPGGGSGGNGGNGGGGFQGGGSTVDTPAADESLAGGEGEQALAPNAATDAQPTHRQIDWLTSAMLALLGACALGLIMVIFVIAKRRRTE